MRVWVAREVRDRLERHQAHKKALKEFVETVERGEKPSRIFKKSGVNRKGERFAPYIELKLWHHHLSKDGDPLLIMQEIDDALYVFAIADHENYMHGDKMLWLKTHHAGIDWTNHKELEERVTANAPGAPQMPADPKGAL